MKYILSLIIGGALVVSGFGQTRNVLVGTNNAVIQPTNFWSADASNARTGLGLGTAATNPASAFQPSSLTLSNLASSNGGGLTNLNATNIVGILSVVQGGTGSTNASDARTALGLGTASTNPATAFQASSSALTNLASGNGVSLTNLQASNLVGVIPSSNIPSVTFTNLSGTLSVAQGGTGATNAANARQNLGSTTVGDALFVATNAEAARTTLSLGTAATSAVTAFQPANANLTNLSTNNGASLTEIPISGVVNLQSNLDTKLATNGNASGLSNITAANITGTVALASNIVGTAPLATNVTGVVALANGGTASTNAASARTSLGATTVGGNLFTLINPSAIRFLRLNADNTATALSASDFRTAIGLDTAATNSALAFQPASTNLNTLAANNASSLTNLQATNLVGLIPASNIPSTTLTNITGTLAIASGGTGATNAATARQNLGSTTVGDAVFIATNAAAARTAIGALTTNSDGAGLTNLTAANITGTVALASNLSSPLSLTNGGTGATNAATARTNLGATTIGNSLFTATNAQAAFDALGIGTNLSTSIIGVSNLLVSSFLPFSARGFIAPSSGGTLVVQGTNLTTSVPAFFGFNGFVNTAFSAAEARTNIGLTLPALTNTNNANFLAAFFGTNTNPVLVNTNGEVVSPTNFWAAAPISTTVQYQTNVTGTSTNAATNSRNLFLFSLAPTVSGVTNTVTLPTNPATTFEGDRAAITHLAQTNTAVTAIRQLGAATNLITLNQLDETVLLIYRSGAWRLADNISYIEPIYFSGTNAAANAAASRTNLGLGATNEVAFGGIVLRDGDALKSEAAGDGDLLIGAFNTVFSGAIGFNNTTNAATTRTNLGIPLPALTNTNNANFRNAIELGATNNVSFSNVTASGTLTATGTVTATTNLVVNGFVDFSTNHTNSNPATNNQINDFIEIRVGTNQFWLPVYK
jgi:hypothetical protein